jgi:hypothetical protein
MAPQRIARGARRGPPCAQCPRRGSRPTAHGVAWPPRRGPPASSPTLPPRFPLPQHGLARGQRPRRGLLAHLRGQLGSQLRRGARTAETPLSARLGENESIIFIIFYYFILGLQKGTPMNHVNNLECF